MQIGKAVQLIYQDETARADKKVCFLGDTLDTAGLSIELTYS